MPSFSTRYTATRPTPPAPVGPAARLDLSLSALCCPGQATVAGKIARLVLDSQSRGPFLIVADAQELAAFLEKQRRTFTPFELAVELARNGFPTRPDPTAATYTQDRPDGRRWSEQD